MVRSWVQLSRALAELGFQRLDGGQGLYFPLHREVLEVVGEEMDDHRLGTSAQCLG